MSWFKPSGSDITHAMEQFGGGSVRNGGILALISASVFGALTMVFTNPFKLWRHDCKNTANGEKDRSTTEAEKDGR